MLKYFDKYTSNFFSSLSLLLISVSSDISLLKYFDVGSNKVLKYWVKFSSIFDNSINPSYRKCHNDAILRNNRNYSIPKLINTNNQKRYNSFYGNKSNIFKNIKNIRFYTPEPLRVTKNGKIIYKLKRVFNDGNYNYN